jgi:hypothetical protein
MGLAAWTRQTPSPLIFLVTIVVAGFWIGSSVDNRLLILRQNRLSISKGKKYRRGFVSLFSPKNTYYHKNLHKSFTNPKNTLK